MRGEIGSQKDALAIRSMDPGAFPEMGDGGACDENDKETDPEEFQALSDS